ncbi:MAG: hypothetical protein C4326_12145 [Ignavibacteria bacterium]
MELSRTSLTLSRTALRAATRWLFGLHYAVRTQASSWAYPATGKAISVGAIAIVRIVNGKIAELRGQFDQMGMMQQLGVIPTAG